MLAAFETHQLDRSAAAEAEAAAAAAAFAAGGDEPFVRSNSGDDPMDAEKMVKTDGRKKKRGNEERGMKSVRGPGPGPFASADSESAGVTYLTAAPLLRLQLRDAAFRRHFLTQCAVFLNHRDDVARVHLKPETKRNASDASQEPALKPEKKDDEDVAVASERKARAEAERLRRRVFAQLAATPRGREIRRGAHARAPPRAALDPLEKE